MNKWQTIPSLYRRMIYLVLFLIFSFFIYKNLVQVPHESSALVEYSWMPVEEVVLENSIGLVGKIESSDRRTLIAPFEGRLENIDVSFGDIVRDDQVVATLDTSLLDIRIREANSDYLKAQSDFEELNNWKNSSELGQARRALSSAETSLQNTLDELSQAQHLFDRGIVPRNEVESLERQAHSQRLDVTERRDDLKSTLERGTGVNLNIAEMQKTNSEISYKSLVELRSQNAIIAPFDGIVLPSRHNQATAEQHVPQPGMTISQGTALFDIASLESLIATASVDESDLNQIEVGMPVSVTGDGFKGVMLDGTIRSIGAQAIKEGEYGSTSNYEISVAITSLNPEVRRLIRLGMTARLNITTYLNEHGIAVPAEAIFQNEQEEPSVLYREEMSTSPRQLKIEIGRSMPRGVEIFGVNSGYIRVPR